MEANAIVEWDSDFRVKRWSARAEDIFGWQELEVLGKHWYDWQFVCSEDIEHIIAIAARLLNGTEPCNISQNRNYTKDGLMIDCEWYNSILLDESGNLISIFSLVQDVSEQQAALRKCQLAESKLRIKTRQQEGIAELGKYALAKKNLVLLMKRAVNLVASILEVEYCQVWELLPDEKNLLLKAGVGWHDGLVGVITVSADNNSQAGYILLSSKPVIVTDLPSETRFNVPALLLERQIVSGMGVIVLGRARPFGVLSTHTTRQRIFSQDDINFIQAIANIVAQAVERYQIEESLRVSEERYRSMYDNIPVMQHSIDSQGKLISVSNYWLEKLGYKREEVLGRKSIQFLTEESQKYATEIVLPQFFRQGFCQDIPYQLVKKNGEIVDVLLSAIAEKDFDGSFIRSLAILIDVTAKKQLENQFFQIQRLESLGTLAGGIAHDLNNILAPILGLARLISVKLPELDEQTKGCLKIIETNAQRGTALVKQILTFARGLEGKCGSVQIRHLILEIQQIIQETFPKTIELYINVPKNLWTVKGDANQLHQVLMNLVVNARDAMPQGGKLTITGENVTVDNNYARLHLDASKGSYVLITVTDNGTGIPSEIIKRIFEPFFTTKKIGRGTGLGLSTVISIVKSHGGFVNVASNSKLFPRGSQFQVFLPASEKVAIIEKMKELPPGNGELILVVDDEPSIREVTKATLETYNYRVLTARDGIEALTLYARNLNEIDIVLIDIIMPLMDGQTAIRNLKKINPEVKIIAMSGLVSNCELISELGNKIAVFLAKPYTIEELLTTLRSQLTI